MCWRGDWPLFHIPLHLPAVLAALLGLPFLPHYHHGQCKQTLYYCTVCGDALNSRKSPFFLVFSIGLLPAKFSLAVVSYFHVAPTLPRYWHTLTTTQTSIESIEIVVDLRNIFLLFILCIIIVVICVCRSYRERESTLNPIPTKRPGYFPFSFSLLCGWKLTTIFFCCWVKEGGTTPTQNHLVVGWLLCSPTGCCCWWWRWSEESVIVTLVKYRML